MSARHWVTACGVLLAVMRLAAAEVVVDGRTAAGWQACTGWTGSPPQNYGVTAEGSRLVFSAQGANTEMPWLLRLEPLGVTGEERYVVIRYQATGLANPAAGYFLHGEEGTYGGRAYAMANEIQSDGQWHTLAVDLVSVQPAEATHNLALKVIVDQGGAARLVVDSIRFAAELPADARVAGPTPRRAQARTDLEWQKVTTIEPRTGWTTAPASDYGAEIGPEGMTFAVRDAGKGMRWLVTAPQPVDLARTPYLSLRYRVTGDMGPETYAIWMGDMASGSGGSSVVALAPVDLKCDGAWHTVQVEVKKKFVAPYLAIGVDCLATPAALTLGNLTFTSSPRRWTVAETLPYEARAGAWTDGEGGFRVLPQTSTGGQASPFLLQRLDLEDWFTAGEVTVNGVPFRVPTDPAQVAVTGTAGFGELTFPLPAGTGEVYLLAAAAAPPTEPWGIDWANPRPQDLLNVPEKVYYEIRYAQGPPDRVLPLDAASGQWGLRRGLSVSVVHPDPKRKATALVLHDRMQTASFGIVGATLRTGAALVAEPTWKALSYPTPPPGALAKASSGAAPTNGSVVDGGAVRCEFTTEAGLSWAALGLKGLPGKLACDAGPVFEVRVGGKLLPAADWRVESTIANGVAGPGGRRFVVRNATAGLLALVDCAPGKGHEVRLRMQLTNEGAAPVTATLHFPVLNGVKLGAAADTWYLYGKRGGLINAAGGRWRDPLGERHPLQVDGFFNPRTGLALACLTHDTVAQHHFRNLAKTADGGEWAVEYVDRDLGPGQTFTATEAALQVREGDWRAIFAAYREWLATWYKPVSPRKPWFERIFALSSGNAHYDASPDPQVRGNVQRLVDTLHKYIGPCDYVHLFGWGSSKQYGDWGDYNHYDEVGGLEYFRGNIQKVQQQGLAVSLYLDGYLSSEKGQVAGSHAREWAMKRPDGAPQFVSEYQSYNQCPYVPGWRQHLADTYARVHRELGSKVLYIDEIGSTDGRWTCWAKDHGHNGHEIPYAGEVELLKGIRGAVGPEVALYTEYPPAEVSRQYTDGSITYQALWSAEQEALAPHFIDLPRFAFPNFKQLHIIYYVGNRAGNWWLLKFPFFNGDVYRIGEPNVPGMDAPSLAFQKRAVVVQCAHRDAFASANVEPLVRTEAAGVFANRFSAPRETVWTLYNANGRNVRGTVLRVKHVAGATYEDAWEGKALKPVIRNGLAELSLDLGPKAVGCVVQRRK